MINKNNNTAQNLQMSLMGLQKECSKYETSLVDVSQLSIEDIEMFVKNTMVSQLVMDEVKFGLNSSESTPDQPVISAKNTSSSPSTKSALFTIENLIKKE